MGKLFFFLITNDPVIIILIYIYISCNVKVFLFFKGLFIFSLIMNFLPIKETDSHPFHIMHIFLSVHCLWSFFELEYSELLCKPIHQRITLEFYIWCHTRTTAPSFRVVLFRASVSFSHTHAVFSILLNTQGESTADLSLYRSVSFQVFWSAGLYPSWFPQISAPIP